MSLSTENPSEAYFFFIHLLLVLFHSPFELFLFAFQGSSESLYNNGDNENCATEDDSELPQLQLSNVIINGESVNDKLSGNPKGISAPWNSNITIRIMSKEEDIFRQKVYKYQSSLRFKVLRKVSIITATTKTAQLRMNHRLTWCLMCVKWKSEKVKCRYSLIRSINGLRTDRTTMQLNQNLGIR